MNKRIAIPIISVLAAGAIVLGVFYFQETNKLNDAQSEIAGLEGNVSALETLLTAVEAEVTRLGGELIAAQAQVSTLETDLAAAGAEVSTLEIDLAAAGAEVSTLETDLATAEARVSTLGSNLATAEARVSTLEADLVAVEAQVSALEAELAASEIEPAAPLGSAKVYLLPGLILRSSVLPAIITVPVGTTVTWINITNFEHTVTSYPRLFNSGRLSLGESFSYTFTQPGVFNYNCTLEDCPYHEERTGKVIVE